MRIPLTDSGRTLIEQRMQQIPYELDKIRLSEIFDDYIVSVANQVIDKPIKLTSEIVKKYKNYQSLDQIKCQNIRMNQDEQEKFQLYQEALETLHNPWTQKLLAALLHTSVDTIRRMSHPKKGGTEETIRNVARVLGIEPIKLVDPQQWKLQTHINTELEATIYPLEFQALIKEKIYKFVGREFVFDTIQDFFNKQEKGYFTIVGEPGQGKSTILAKYVYDNKEQCVVHFNVRAEGKNRADYFLESVCTQIIKRYKLNYPTLPSRAFEDGVFLSILLEQVSQLLKDEERLVIAIDALDEVDEDSQKKERICFTYLDICRHKSIFF